MGESSDDRFREARLQFQEELTAVRRRMLTMTLERERLLAHFKMATDAMQTLRSRAQTGSDGLWLVETEVIAHLERVLHRVRDIANGKEQP